MATKTRASATKKATAPAKMKAKKPKAASGSQRSEAIARWARSIEAAGADRGWSRAETATYLGISIGYFNVLLTGGGENQKAIGRPLIEGSAKLLGTSVLNICLQAGMLTLSDLYYETDHVLTLEAAYKRMAADPELCSHLPSPDEWAGKVPLSTRSKYGITLLFELASRNLMLDKAEIFAPED